jgi:NAD(P)-dependent dehydrogenase (short-subunit alcohol dehydrogenase family)
MPKLTKKRKRNRSRFKHLGSIWFLQTDISDENSVKNLIRETKNNFDGIDILVNNAALAAPENSPITELV